MDINQIKQKVKHFFSRIWKFIRETVKLPYAKTYIFSSILLIVIFLIITFPYSILIRTKLMELEKNMFRSVNVGEIETSFFDVSVLEDLSITTKSGDTINVLTTMINTSLNPYTLLVKKDYKGDLQLKSLKYDSSKFNLFADMNSNFDINMTDKSNLPVNSEVKIILENAVLTLEDIKIPIGGGEGLPLELPPIKMTSVNIITKIHQRKILVEKFQISGNDLRGNITGTIILSNFFKNSKINLNIIIDKESAVLKEYQMLLSSLADPSGKIKIPVSGTFARPSVNITPKFPSMENKNDTDNSKKPER